MNTSNGTEGGQGAGKGGGIRSLRDLPLDIAPPRDLWPSISAQLEKRAGPVVAAEDAGSHRLFGPRGPRLPGWLAAAAVIAALAVGMWLGRSVLPASGGSQVPPTTVASNPSATPPAPTTSPTAVPAVGTPAGDAQQVFASTYIIDPRYNMNRQAMVRDLETRLKTLPPDTQVKVSASLTTIRASMTDIEAALGRDPANALLQEMLINTYQDEMRVLTAVNEASDAGRGT